MMPHDVSTLEMLAEMSRDSEQAATLQVLRSVVPCSTRSKHKDINCFRCCLHFVSGAMLTGFMCSEHVVSCVSWVIRCDTLSANLCLWFLYKSTFVISVIFQDCLRVWIMLVWCIKRESCWIVCRYVVVVALVVWQEHGTTEVWSNDWRYVTQRRTEASDDQTVCSRLCRRLTVYDRWLCIHLGSKLLLVNTVPSESTVPCCLSVLTVREILIVLSMVRIMPTFSNVP